MKFIVEINCDNFAFENPQELPNILMSLAQKMEDGHNVDGIKLRDTNGNIVGFSQFSDLTEEEDY